MTSPGMSAQDDWLAMRAWLATAKAEAEQLAATTSYDLAIDSAAGMRVEVLADVEAFMVNRETQAARLAADHQDQCGCDGIHCECADEVMLQGAIHDRLKSIFAAAGVVVPRNEALPVDPWPPARPVNPAPPVNPPPPIPPHP